MRRGNRYSPLWLACVIALSFGVLVAQQPTVVNAGGSERDMSRAERMLAALPASTDTVVPIDSLKADSIRRASKETLTAPVKYQANDSIVMTSDNIAYLFGQSKITYNQIELESETIKLITDSSKVTATYGVDTLGVEFGYPIFTDGGESYESKSMSYNFKSRKGYITDVVTKQGEGYMTAAETKRMANDDIYLRNGRYTTCDHVDHPHFYLQLTKAKMRPGKNVVAGPAYLVVEDVPLPIALPFGFFPFSDKYSSGIIMPTFGDDFNRGFYLQNGGYYWAASDYFDLALTGEIYSKGSWGLTGKSTYKKRYAFNGAFNLSFLSSVMGEKGMPDYNVGRDFRIQWTHSQDSKLDPFSSLSASVNYGTSSFTRKEVNSVYGDDFTENTKSSSINFSQRFPNSPFSLSASMNISQRSKDSSVSVSLPNLQFTLSRIYPFKRKKAVGKERWYEKIYFSYSGSLRNSINTKDNLLFKSNLIKDWKNGMQHSIPIGASFQLFKYINISPSMNYTERWYSNRVDQSWNPMEMRVENDTTYGFYRVYNYNAAVSMQTKLYGFYKPMKWLSKLTSVDAIRHVMTPSVSVSAAPDFGSEFFGFYESYYRPDAQGNVSKVTYSPFSGGMFGTAPRGKSGLVSMQLQNNVEMKIRSDEDSTGYKKVSLIDNLSLGMSYNMAADSMNWSDLNSSIRIKFGKAYTLSLSGQWDVYTYQLNAQGNPVRVNVPRWEAGKGFARFKGTSSSFSYTFDQNTWTKWFGDKDEKDKVAASIADTASVSAGLTGDPVLDDVEDDEPIRRKKRDTSGEYDEDGYYNNKIPWSLSVNYSFRWANADFNKETLEYNRKWTHSFDMSARISPFPSWSLSVSTSFDFKVKEFTYMNCSVSKDLHCWQISGSFVPLGPYKSYNISIAASSSLLKDLKYNKQSNYNEVLEFY